MTLEDPREALVVGVELLERRAIGVLGDPDPAGGPHDVAHEAGELVGRRLEDEDVALGVLAPIAREAVLEPRVEREAEDLVEDREQAPARDGALVATGREEAARVVEADRDDRVDAQDEAAAVRLAQGEPPLAPTDYFAGIRRYICGVLPLPIYCHPRKKYGIDVSDACLTHVSATDKNVCVTFCRAVSLNHSASCLFTLTFQSSWMLFKEYELLLDNLLQESK